MSRHPQRYPWTDVVSSHFPHLSKPLAAGLAWWSLGMIIARSCSLTAVAGILAPLLSQPFNTVRERLRDTYREAPAKAYKCRFLSLSPFWIRWQAIAHG